MARGRRVRVATRANANASANGSARRRGREWHGTAINSNKERLGQRERARVDEGSGTCKRVVLAWHEGRHHQRRRGGTERLRVPPRLEGRGIHMSKEAVVLTLVATGRSAGIGAVWWCGSSAGKKMKAAARCRGSRGSRGSRRSQRWWVRLLPRVAPVFTADGSSPPSPPLLSLPP
jgi:hypothetical protein